MSASAVPHQLVVHNVALSTLVAICQSTSHLLKFRFPVPVPQESTTCITLPTLLPGVILAPADIHVQRLLHTQYHAFPVITRIKKDKTLVPNAQLVPLARSPMRHQLLALLLPLAMAPKAGTHSLAQPAVTQSTAHVPQVNISIRVLRLMQKRVRKDTLATIVSQLHRCVLVVTTPTLVKSFAHFALLARSAPHPTAQ